jgi:hypothetical protein
MHTIYRLWCEFTNTDEETANPEVNDAKTKATNVTNAPAQQDVGFVDAEGVYHTGPAPSPSPAAQPAARRVQRAAPGGAAKRGGSPTAVANGDGKKQIEDYLGRQISSDEYDMLTRAVYSESSRNKDEYANVMAVILNRTRKNGGSIIDTLLEKNQFQAVTGTANNPGPSSMFTRGPDVKSQAMINEGALSLSGISKNLDAFTAANRNAYGPGTNVGWLDKLQARGGKQIGQTVFAENMYKGGGTTALASAPNTGDSLAYAQNSLSSFQRMLAMSPQGGQVINNNTTNAVMGGGSQDGRSVNPHNADLMKYIISQVS